jgi:hypothetical protein
LHGQINIGLRHVTSILLNFRPCKQAATQNKIVCFKGGVPCHTDFYKFCSRKTKQVYKSYVFLAWLQKTFEILLPKSEKANEKVV